jgi:hypothetical protein
MPSDTPPKKRRTHYDLDRHLELFLEATSLDAVTTKTNILAPERNQASVVQSVDAPYKHTNRGTANHNYIFRQCLSAFFRKSKHAARFGQ